MTWAQAAPWLMDALQLWLTSDQEVEISELQRMMKPSASGEKPETGERSEARCNEPLIGSGEWIEQMDWLETEGAARGRCHFHDED